MRKASKYFEQILQNRILKHFLFWVCILCFYPIYALSIEESPLQFTLEKLFLLPTQILATYFLIYFQIPTLILKRKYLLFVISFIIGTYVFGTTTHYIRDYITAAFLPIDIHICTPYTIFTDLGTAIVSSYWVYLIAFFAAGLKLIQQHFERKKQLTLLEKEKLEAELNYLKAQIHPHFLANTLDHLHQLTLKKSDLAPDVVIKLSDTLDYMLYRCNEPTVLLSKEMELIQNYLELEELRMHGNLKWIIQNQITDSTVQIAPLVLLPVLEQVLEGTLLESEIKYNLKIGVDLEEDRFHFHLLLSSGSLTSNSPLPRPKTPLLEKSQKQLDLIYPGQYSLQNNLQSNRIDVLLTLPVQQLPSLHHKTTLAYA